MKKRPVFIIYIIMSVGFVYLDRVFKNLVIDNMQVGDAFPSQDAFAAIRYVRNTGVSFSLFAGHTEILIVVQSILFAAIAFACVMTYKRLRHPLLQTGLSWIVAGGAGNLVDRVTYGYVIDYISVGTFPVWNFADMCVVGGCILMGIYILFIYGKQRPDDEIKGDACHCEHREAIQDEPDESDE